MISFTAKQQHFYSLLNLTLLISFSLFFSHRFGRALGQEPLFALGVLGNGHQHAAALLVAREREHSVVLQGQARGPQRCHVLAGFLEQQQQGACSDTHAAQSTGMRDGI